MQVIINTEWGAFGNGGALNFLRTDVDRDIDESSINPGKQMYVTIHVKLRNGICTCGRLGTFNILTPKKHLMYSLFRYEKMISGMYMGEMVRRVIVQCAEKGYLFKGMLLCL